jgi:hypothetical protein
LPNGPSGGRTALIVAIAASICLSLLPWDIYRLVAWPLMLFSTYAHEMGHGLTARLLGGTFHQFVMTPGGAGLATFSLPSGSTRIGTAIASAGGLVGPAVLAAIFFRMARTPRLAHAALTILAIFGGLSVLLVVRNAFGIAYVLSVAVAALACARFVPARGVQLIVMFLAVQLSMSVYTRSDYLFMETANGTGPSDVAQMAAALFLPYWFWGFVCAGFSALILLWGVRGVLKSTE